MIQIYLDIIDGMPSDWNTRGAGGVFPLLWTTFRLYKWLNGVQEDKQINEWVKLLW